MVARMLSALSTSLKKKSQGSEYNASNEKHIIFLVLALAAMTVVFQLLTGSFITTANIVSILQSSGVPVILAVAASFVILMGSIDLSLEGVLAVASMSLALLVSNDVNANHSFIIGLLTCLGIGLLFGIANGLLNAYLRLPSLIVTLGVWFIGLGIAATMFPGRVPRINDPIVLALARLTVFGLPPLVYIAVAVVILAELILRFTKIGRMIYAIGGDEHAVIASGLAAAWYRLCAFAISGVLVSVAALLLSAQLGSGNANIGSGLLFSSISAAVLGGTTLMGGRGSAIQSALGALVLQVLNNGLVLTGVDTYTRDIALGAVIVVGVSMGGWNLRRRLRVVK